MRSGSAEVAACDVEMGLGIFEDDLTSGSRQRALTHCAAVEQWGVAVVADRRASDDHLNLVSCAWDRSAEQPSPCLLRIAEDIALARIEMVDGNDDFVVGLSMDLTRASDAVDDPRDDEAPAVPVLLLRPSHQRVYCGARLRRCGQRCARACSGCHLRARRDSRVEVSQAEIAA